MYEMSRKLIAALGIVGFLASAGVAFAQTASSSATPHAMPMVLEVGQGGKVLLRGTVTSVAAGSVTITSWGGVWTVTVPSSATVLPSGTALTSFQQGDFVGVQGLIDQNANWTVTASLIRDWTAKKAVAQQAQSNRQAVRQAIASGPRVIEGTLSNLDATSQTFTLTARSGVAYTVTLNSGAKIIGRNWATINLGQAKAGDTVRVFGSVSSSTIAASVFRDVSVK